MDLDGFWVGRMDGGEILGRNASMASQESRIGGISQLIMSGRGAISNSPKKMFFFVVFCDIYDKKVEIEGAGPL